MTIPAALEVQVMDSPASELVSGPYWQLRNDKKAKYAVLRGLDDRYVRRVVRFAEELAAQSLPPLRLRFKFTAQVRVWWIAASKHGEASPPDVHSERDGIPFALHVALEEVVRSLKADFVNEAQTHCLASVPDSAMLDAKPALATKNPEDTHGTDLVASAATSSEVDDPLEALGAAGAVEALPIARAPPTFAPTLVSVRRPPLPSASQMNMPLAVRAALDDRGNHSDMSRAFARYASSRCSDDWVEWVAPAPALDDKLAGVLESEHAEARFLERWGEARRVELLRSLRSGEGGAFRAVARTARVALVVRDARFEFSMATGRLLTCMVNRGRLSNRAEKEPLPAELVVLLQEGIRSAAAGMSPGFCGTYRPLDSGIAIAALSVLSSRGPVVWYTMFRLVAVTTTASLVLSDVPASHIDAASTASMSLITLLTCDASQEFSAWKREHARHDNRR